MRGQPLQVRRPQAIRPWQHVLEPLSGYISLAEQLWQRPMLAGAYNFGPEPTKRQRSATSCDSLATPTAPEKSYAGDGTEGQHEAAWLALEIAKARTTLGFSPRWSLADAVSRTLLWYRQQRDGAAARALCEADIDAYEAARAASEMTSRFAVLDTPLADLKVVERQQLSDTRGFLSRLFCAEELAAAGWRKPVAQINQTLTRRQGAELRGMHYQRPPHAEMKLVSLLARGRLGRCGRFAQRLTYLSAMACRRTLRRQRRAMLIPEGFAHGFQTLAENCELLYLHSVAYVPEAEAA